MFPSLAMTLSPMLSISGVSHLVEICSFSHLIIHHFSVIIQCKHIYFRVTRGSCAAEMIYICKTHQLAHLRSIKYQHLSRVEHFYNYTNPSELETRLTVHKAQATAQTVEMQALTHSLTGSCLPWRRTLYSLQRARVIGDTYLISSVIASIPGCF